MPPLVRGFGWEVDKVVGLLVPQMRRHILGILGRLGSLSLGTLVMAFYSDRDPLAQGRCSFVGEHLTNSIALEGDDLVLSGRRIVCSRSRKGGFVCYSGKGSVGRGPSI